MCFACQVVSNIFLMFLHTSKIEYQVKTGFFYGSCSRHMTGNCSYFSNLIECSSEHVTFGDAVKGWILAKGDIVSQYLPRFEDVRYVEGLITANLISISQLCEQEYTVNFYKEDCIVIDVSNAEVMRGMCQPSNFYHWRLNKTKYL